MAGPSELSPVEFDPKNPWARLTRILAQIAERDFEKAQRALDGLRHHRDLSPQVLAPYAAHLARARHAAGYRRRMNIPSDYTADMASGLRKPFRQLTATREVPAPYPAGLVLPHLAGARNDTLFLRDTAAVWAPARSDDALVVDVILCATAQTDIATLTTGLAAQDFKGTVRVLLLCPETVPLPDITNQRIEVLRHSILSAPAQHAVAQRAQAGGSDLTIYLNGAVTLDAQFVTRAVFLGRISGAVVQPLIQAAPDHLLTGWHAAHPISRNRFPYHAMEGLNFVAPTDLLARVGPPDARFATDRQASRELGYRMFHQGAYFVPVAVPAVAPPVQDLGSDGSLFVSLCPSHWDRKPKVRGPFERPRVNIYIPTYNAAKYIRRAVDSVLAQDMADLDVCIADDGSTDDTLDVLHTHYGTEPRVRIETGANGGIGHASNRAIAMGEAPYIGQLDSDDCLKPGAVRRLMQMLDDDGALACAYSACERIDAQGGYVKDEYNWPTFSREKMAITSITHHFRMFRRAAFARTTGFREDIVNAVDYDLFLKLAETGQFEHVNEVLYQRRWHGENTSDINEAFQTANTHIAQNEMLERAGLSRFWELEIKDPATPRRVSYARRAGVKTVLFWPDYARVNPYQHLLYAKLRDTHEVLAGDIDTALEQLPTFRVPSDLVFHLHWLNFVLIGAADRADATARVDSFLAKITRFVAQGGRLVWTVHNTLSHEAEYPDLEQKMSRDLARLAHCVHLHAASSAREVAQSYDIPRDKLHIARHGHYLGTYPDFVTPQAARAQLDLRPQDDVILFIGQIRPYKQIELLIEAYQHLRRDNPDLVLLIAGEQKYDPLNALSQPLSDEARAGIRMTGRFIDDMELQVFMKAADCAALPYRDVLTSGSALLALSFGVPVVAPGVAMMRELLGGRRAGVLYEPSAALGGLVEGLETILQAKREDRLNSMRQQAQVVALSQTWPDPTFVINT